MRHSPPLSTPPTLPLDVTVVQPGKVSVYRIVDPAEAALVKAAIERAAERDAAANGVRQRA